MLTEHNNFVAAVEDPSLATSSAAACSPSRPGGDGPGERAGAARAGADDAADLRQPRRPSPSWNGRTTSRDFTTSRARRSHACSPPRLRRRAWRCSGPGAEPAQTRDRGARNAPRVRRRADAGRCARPSAARARTRRTRRTHAGPVLAVAERLSRMRLLLLGGLAPRLRQCRAGPEGASRGAMWMQKRHEAPYIPDSVGGGPATTRASSATTICSPTGSGICASCSAAGPRMRREGRERMKAQALIRSSRPAAAMCISCSRAAAAMLSWSTAVGCTISTTPLSRAEGGDHRGDATAALAAVGLVARGADDRRPAAASSAGPCALAGGGAGMQSRLHLLLRARGRLRRRGEIHGLETAKASVDLMLAGKRPGERAQLGLHGRRAARQPRGVARSHALRRRARLSGAASTWASPSPLTAHCSMRATRVFRDLRLRCNHQPRRPAELHDRLRPFKSGRGSYRAHRRAVAPLLARQRRAQVSARVTVDSGSRDLPGILDAFVAMGFHSVGFSPMLNSPSGREEMGRRRPRTDAGGHGRLRRRVRAANGRGRALPLRQHVAGAARDRSRNPSAVSLRGGRRAISASPRRAICSPAIVSSRMRPARWDRWRAASTAPGRPIGCATAMCTGSRRAAICWARYLCGGGCHHETIARERRACDYIRGWLHYCLGAYARLSAAHAPLIEEARHAAI